MLILLLACQQPFGTNRHDLEGFRVAALSVEPAGGPAGAPIAPQGAIVVDGQLWSDDPVDMRWYWTEATDRAVTEAAGEPDAVGPTPTLTMEPSRLVLVATAGDAEYRAFIDLPLEAVANPALNGVDVSDLGVPFADLTAPDFTIASRAARAGALADGVPAGGTARFSARLGTDQPFLRWMSTAGGSFFELDAVTTDWMSGAVEVDDEDVILGETVPDGSYALLALALGASGNNAFAGRDFFVGDRPTGLFTTGDRFIPAPADFAATLVRGTLVADAGPSGLALTGAVAVAEADLPEEDPYGTAGLCGVWNRPFDPSWLLTQRCTRTDVLDHVVVVEAR